MFNFTLQKHGKPKQSTSPEITNAIVTHANDLVTEDLSTNLRVPQVKITTPPNTLDQMYLNVPSDPLDPLISKNDIITPEDELTVKNYKNLGKMIAIRLRQLKSKRIARNCEIEIMNMVMNAELQDCEQIKT